MKVKTLLTLPRDLKSIELATLRIHHHLYYWLTFDTNEIDVINIEKFERSVERKSGAVASV